MVPDLCSGFDVAPGFFWVHSQPLPPSEEHPQLDDSPDDHEDNCLAHGNPNDVRGEQLARLLGVEEAIRLVEVRDERGVYQRLLLTVEVLCVVCDVRHTEVACEDDDGHGKVYPSEGSDVGENDLEDAEETVESVFRDVRVCCVNMLMMSGQGGSGMVAYS